MAYSMMGQIGVPAAGGFFDGYDESDDGGGAAGAGSTAETDEAGSKDTTQMDMMGAMDGETHSGATAEKAEKDPFDAAWDDLQTSDDIPETEDPTDHLADYDELKELIDKIEKNTTAIEDLEMDIATVTQSKEETAILRKLQTVMTENGNVQCTIKKKLEQMSEANEKFEKENPSSSIAQWRKNQLNTCTRRFKDASSEFQLAIKQFHQELRDKQRRQIKNYDSRLDDAQVDDMVEDPAKASEFIKATVQMTDISDAMLDRLAELEERHEGMVAIQKGMQELNEMWRELAVLITEQQEMLDNIEFNVDQTHHYVEKGVVQLVKAEDHQRAARKYKLWVTACGVIILLVIVMSVLGGTGSFGKS
jgi:t-SNARE complex subunit (syntaxin)